MILNQYSLTSGGACLNYKANPKSYVSAPACFNRVLFKVAFPNITSSWRPNQELKSGSSKGIQSLSLSAGSSPSLEGDLCGLSHAIPTIPRLHQVKSQIRAAKDVPTTYRFPGMTNKPRWWWRTLACLPYLMLLHETWMYAEMAYHLHPFLEDFEFLTLPFLEALSKLPKWFLLAYFFVAYLGIVRRKEWPHFFRFHVVTGMLLQISLQVVWSVSRWLPKALYWGKVGMHFWTAFAFAFLFTVLESIRCALAGM